MPDDVIIDHLDLMLESVELILSRFSAIKTADDFVLSSDGVTLLDAIVMRLQVIGETVRKIQKSAPELLAVHSGVQWDNMARFRDLVSHHYTQIDHEIVFDICAVHIPLLKKELQKMRSALQG